MADRKTTARNGYQDAADMAIVGRYRGPASSSAMPPADTDEVILASLEENKNGLRKLFSFVREMKDRLQESQWTIIGKEDKVLEALVRLKRPVYDDVEFERAQAINEFRMALLQEETVVAQAQAMAASQKLREVRGIIIAASMGIVGVLLTFGLLCWLLF